MQADLGFQWQEFCKSVGDSAFISSSFDAISLPSVVSLGSTVYNNSVFSNIKSNITITVPIALQTANAGTPDGDLVYASGTRAATIVYI